MLDARVLAHEFAHEILHAGISRKENGGKIIVETEADAAAYAVCRHFGIKCNTSDYLLEFKSEPKILMERMERIRKAASRIIEAVESAMGTREEAAA